MAGDEFLGRVRLVVRTSGLSYTRLGKLAKIHPTSLSRFMTGDVVLSGESLGRLLDVLGCRLGPPDVEWLDRQQTEEDPRRMAWVHLQKARDCLKGEVGSGYGIQDYFVVGLYGNLFAMLDKLLRFKRGRSVGKGLLKSHADRVEWYFRQKKEPTA
jgi:hypothetical protein